MYHCGACVHSWSNTSLQQFLIAQVKQIIKDNPTAAIVSVSQNDNGAYCQTPDELAIIKEEGTPGGAMFRAINVIAAAVQDEFPNVAIDTLAYQWSRPAPAKTVPLPNVIIRLCCTCPCACMQPDGVCLTLLV